MQSSPWMQTALMLSEAVLMPALPRVTTGRTRPPERLRMYNDNADAFRPVEQAFAENSGCRAAGSMAGRGVLRAAGVPCGMPTVGRPTYAPVRRSLRLERWRQG